ncbi:type IV secretion system protein DotC [Trinickia terrae]|uniref:Type IV secretion system protein DotC n=1 Tax=Trinickia terrae TaxID=2571161 RepID=A0A4U1I9G4_9BURK|nr:type IV secretory system conjugative DNA transfer family protein [Trinickia terrae]TKC90128.1 type IV secretion system protein DotC [Trinickia terrae]
MPIDTVSLDALQSLNQPAIVQSAAAGPGTHSLGNIRLDAVRDAAFGLGARGGLIDETRMIQSELKTRAREYDTVYDFAHLMIQGRVVPPVLTQERDLYTLKGMDTIRIAQQDWTIFSQARFTSRPPTWREYLMADPGPLAMPAAELLPTSDNEREIWKKAVAAGWQAGIQQADESFKINANRLTRDYRGMVNYHILALKKMVTLPIVAQMDMPLNSRGDSMSMGETVLRLTALPSFDTNMKKWQPLSGEVDRLQAPGDGSPAPSPSPDGVTLTPVLNAGDAGSAGGN